MTNSYDPFMEVTVDNPNALTEAEAEQERELSLELEADRTQIDANLSLIHISEPTRPY